MTSTHYLNYLGTVWENLSEVDKERMGELWQGFEQVFASVYQKFIEGRLNVVQQDLVPFTTERWLNYAFSEDNFLDQPAIFTSTQDLSVGINLLTRKYLYLSVDDGPPILVNIQGANPISTQLTEIIAKINAAFLFTFAKAIFDGTILQLTSPTSGLTSKITIHPAPNPAEDAAEFVLGLEPAGLPLSYPEFHYTYSSPYASLASIPVLQDKIRDEDVAVTLTEGVDYEVQNKTVIAFKEEPPASLWARRSLFDQENPWNNFGFLMDIYQPNSQRYVNILQGLWFAFWTGPKPDNIKKSLYLLFGLPTAKESGTVTEVTPTTITTTGNNGVVTTFDIPAGLVAIVTKGQAVTQFQPLVSGIEVFDKINYPGFIAEEIGRAGVQRFLLDEASRGPGDTDETKALTMLEEHCFLPQILVESFISNDINLSNVRTFLDAIKPLSKTYLFQIIVGNFKDELAVGDSWAADIEIDVTENVDSNETTFLQQSDLVTYETVNNPGLNVDQNGVSFGETVQIEVYSFGSLIDSFVA